MEMEMELDEYRQKIADFSDWLKKEFVTNGCGDPKVEGCLSCEAVLATQSLDAMVRVLAPPSPQQQEMK
jgi:hypothetical protein